MDDYDYIRMNEPEAVAYVPQKHIYFLGFGMFAQYRDKAKSEILVKWLLGDNGLDYESDWIEITTEPEKRHMKFYWHTIDIRTYGKAPLKVLAGQEIHLVMKMKKESGDGPRLYYGRNGDEYNYKQNTDQELGAFRLTRSPFNKNRTTDTYGQFPFILYA